MTGLMLACGYIVCGFLGLLAATILWMIWTKQIDLCKLLCEANGDASMSRLQLLIFTFVVAVSLFYLVEKGVNPAGFPDIPSGVLTILGISASTYAVSKGISFSREEGVTTKTERSQKRDADVAVANSTVHVARANAQTAAAEAVRADAAASIVSDVTNNPEAHD
jgi:hypothetical protein